ncbi:MAG: family 20 glycosylhydrolase [Candidatus Delongbacteria bacterium]|nr:family 20 glycosylhydrolase [Candidatus Delongbacteria bacterium]
MNKTNIKACMIDISRFRVPTISRMKKMIKNLSEIGYDTVFYNIEHAFKIPNHPKIGSEADGYTIKEFKELDVYAKENLIEIIPLIQSFGHMFHILKYPEYENICESEKKWSLSINDETYKFISDLYKATSKAFSSKYIHIGGDEVYDMASGKSKYLLKQGLTKDEIFLDHILKLKEIANSYDKKIIIWGDMVENNPDIMEKLGENAILCYWNYGFEDMPETYKGLGNNTLVCPGINTWKSFFPRYDFAIKNFQLMKERSDLIFAKGFMITDWGDAGHIHPVSFTENLFKIAYKVFNGEEITQFTTNEKLDEIIKILDEIHFGGYLNAENVKGHGEYVTKHLFHEYVFKGKGFASQTTKQLNSIIDKIEELKFISETIEYSTELEQDIRLFIDQTILFSKKIELHLMYRNNESSLSINIKAEEFIIALRKWFATFMKRWLNGYQPMGLYFHIHFMKKIEKDIIDGLKCLLGTRFNEIKKETIYDDPEYLNLFSVGNSDALIKLWDEYRL